MNALVADERSTWARRIERAQELAPRYPAAAELLHFYERIARFQWGMPLACPLVDQLQPLLVLVERQGPPALSQAAANLRRDATARQTILEGTSADPAHLFFARVLRQASTEHAALHANTPTNMVRNTCPYCGERPLAAVLRPAGEGGKRNLLCSLCLTEWEFRRVLCASCGEEDHHQLPVFKAGEFPHVRMEACDSCRRYLKAIDLTIDGKAVPEVDELAALPLDLWAGENNYTKLTLNILGL